MVGNYDDYVFNFNLKMLLGENYNKLNNQWSAMCMTSWASVKHKKLLNER